MGEVISDGLNVAVVEETSQGASPPPTSGWLNLECDAVGDPGPQYKKMARNPFTITRQLRRPFISGLDCALSLDLDATKDHFDAFGEAMFKSEWKHSGGTGQSKFAVAAAVDGGGGVDSFTVAADGDLAQRTLVVVRGMTNPENEGLFVVAAGSTDTSVKVPTGSLVAEASPPANATLDVAGYQFPVGDLELDVDGNFICTADDFTTKGLQVHQILYLAGADDVDPPYSFDTADYHGFFEILVIAPKKLTVRRRGWTVGAPDDGAGKTIRLFYTKWIRNVARSHNDEKIPTHAFEVAYPGLGPNGEAYYEYLLGYALDQTTFNMPSEGKVTMQLTFVGKTVGDPTAVRLTGPSTALDPVTQLAMSTAADVTRLSVDNIDESGLMTDFQDFKLMLKNNITGKKAVGTLGNRFTPLGMFEAQIEAQVYFTDPDVVTAVHDNRIVRVIGGGRNDDFGAVLDVPSAGAMEAPKTVAHNELITINSKVAGFMDVDSEFTAGLSMFAYLPTRAPGLET